VGALASAQIQALRSSPESREGLRWFLAAENPLCVKVMAELETNGRAPIIDCPQNFLKTPPPGTPSIPAGPKGKNIFLKKDKDIILSRSSTPRKDAEPKDSKS
jgi:hypothetical protein